MPPPEHVPFWEDPAPEQGTPRVSGEPSRRKGSAHRSPEERGLRPPARGATPPTSTRSFVSRRHKSRGDSRSCTGLHCGKAVMREGVQRPGIKVYICILCPPNEGLPGSRCLGRRGEKQTLPTIESLSRFAMVKRLMENKMRPKTKQTDTQIWNNSN